MAEKSGDPPIYLDYNATTPLAPEVETAIRESLGLWGNPSSGYRTGSAAREAVTEARQRVAEMIGAEASEVTFTSGGTESNHLAIWSALASYRSSLRTELSSDCPGGSGPACHNSSTGRPHVVTSNIEHPAITAPLAALEREGLCRVTRVPVVPGAGRWTVQSVLDSVTVDTCLVTLMLANNETGILQPVGELFSRLRQFPPQTRCPVILHSDAAQAVGKVKVDVRELRADMMTVVGHKFYGPRVGCLYHRTGVRVTPMLYGGGQEGGLRPGTENTPMIVGLGAAALLVSRNIAEYSNHLRAVRDYLRDQLIRHFTLVSSDLPVSLARGQICWRYVDRLTLPNTLSLRFGGWTGPALLAACKDELEASCGAACHTGAGASSTLINSFLWGEVGAAETVRLSVGRETSRADIDRVVTALRNACDRMD